MFQYGSSLNTLFIFGDELWRFTYVRVWLFKFFSKLLPSNLKNKNVGDASPMRDTKGWLCRPGSHRVCKFIFLNVKWVAASTDGLFVHMSVHFENFHISPHFFRLRRWCTVWVCTEKTDTSQAGLLPPEGWLQEEGKEGRNKIILARLWLLLGSLCVRSGFNLTQISLRAGSRLDSHPTSVDGCDNRHEGSYSVWWKQFNTWGKFSGFNKSGSMCSSAAPHLLLIVIFPDWQRSLNKWSWFFSPLPILIRLFPAAVDLRVRGAFTRGTALVLDQMQTKETHPWLLLLGELNR